MNYFLKFNSVNKKKKEEKKERERETKNLMYEYEEG